MTEGILMSPKISYAAFAAAGAFLLFLAALHVLKPEFDPSWRLISEYALGDYGWMMTLAFFCLALGCMAVTVAIWRYTGTIEGRIGLLLLVVSVGLSTAAAFTCDPITDRISSLSGMIYAFGALLVIPIFPIAVTLISSSLFRDSGWASAQRWVPWVALLVWIGFLSFIGWIILIVRPTGHHAGTFIG